jgi:hypothetical protein
MTFAEWLFERARAAGLDVDRPDVAPYVVAAAWCAEAEGLDYCALYDLAEVLGVSMDELSASYQQD